MKHTKEKISEQITMVLVETSAFTEVNNDFIGLHSALLPSFFNAAGVMH